MVMELKLEHFVTLEILTRGLFLVMSKGKRNETYNMV